MTRSVIDSLVEAAAAPYRQCGTVAWHFARGKLKHDPVFVNLLRLGLFDAPTRILDLGCGRALLANWLMAAHRHPHAISAATPWTALPAFAGYLGIDSMARDIQVATRAMPAQAQAVCADICSADFGMADRIVMLDVLHYLPHDAQEAVLARARVALSAEGQLILRVGDAAAGWRALQSRLTDHLVLLGRGRGLAPLHCRPLSDWLTLLQRSGFAVTPHPMSEGTAFANTLLVARHA